MMPLLIGVTKVGGAVLANTDTFSVLTVVFQVISKQEPALKEAKEVSLPGTGRAAQVWFESEL